MGRFTGNILQWNKNNIKSSQTTNGDYYFVVISQCVLTFNSNVFKLRQSATFDLKIVKY